MLNIVIEIKIYFELNSHEAINCLKFDSKNLQFFSTRRCFISYYLLLLHEEDLSCLNWPKGAFKFHLDLPYLIQCLVNHL